jgi:putative transposase
MEFTWLAEAPSHCLQQALRDLDAACRRHGTFKVRWRSARRWRPSFRFPEGAKMELRTLNRRKSQVKLPKLGWVKFRASRCMDGETIRSATLTREGRHWFVSLLVDDGVTTPAEHALPGTVVGVDRGVAVAVATSGGALLDQAFTTLGEQRRALRLQRKLSGAARSSANRNKTRQALADLRARERRRRQDFFGEADRAPHDAPGQASCGPGQAGPVSSQRQFRQVRVEPGDLVQGLVRL